MKITGQKREVREIVKQWRAEGLSVDVYKRQRIRRRSAGEIWRLFRNGLAGGMDGYT